MMSEKQQEQYDSLLEIAETLTKECWKLHKELSGTYDHSLAQLNDMILLGKKAESAKDARVLAGKIRELK